MNTVHGGAFSSNLIIYHPECHPSESQMPWQMQSAHRLEFRGMDRAKFAIKYSLKYGSYPQGCPVSNPCGIGAQ